MVQGIHHHYHGYSADLIPFKINCQFSFGCPQHLKGFEFSHELDVGRVIRKKEPNRGVVSVIWNLSGFHVFLKPNEPFLSTKRDLIVNP